MSACRESKIVRDADLLPEYIRERYDVEADIEPCQFREGFNETSAAPLIWLTSRLIDAGAFKCGYPAEADDFEPILLCSVAMLSGFARSRIFRTHLLPRPIDITAARVSVCVYYDKFT